MSEQSSIKQHYRHGDLLKAIDAGIQQLGKTVDSLSLADLAPLEEFHIGGRAASKALLQQLSIAADQQVLDLGCAIGGTARFLASEYKCRVTGIDLSSEYVETGRVLNQRLGLDSLIDLHAGSALATGFDAHSFDAACMLHVGMNIDDKAALFAEVYRLLRPGAAFAIYDIMRATEGELSLPVPWATKAENSSLASVDEYKQGLEKAGFSVVAERDRRDYALDFFQKLREKSAAAKQRPALGLHILMGEQAALKVKNMVANIAAGKITPLELIARKRA